MGRRVLFISGSFFVDLLAEGDHPGYRVTKDPLPADAKIVMSRVIYPDTLELTLESPSWELFVGEAIHEVRPIIAAVSAPPAPPPPPTISPKPRPVAVPQAAVTPKPKS